MIRIALLFLGVLYALPLGDGKYTLSAPRKGYVFVCRVMNGGRGARGDVSWIHGATWDPAAKPAVPGDVKWPDAYVRITVDGATRTIEGNGLPKGYGTGNFPIDPSSSPRATVETIVGWAFDGFPITGAATSNGKNLTTSDLDECHGMTSGVLVDGKLTRTYHYVLTEDFPYSVSCFKGKSYEPHPRIAG